MISKNPKTLQMIYAIDNTQNLVVGALKYTRRLTNEEITETMQKYQNIFKSPEQLSNSSSLDYLIIHKEFRRIGLASTLQEEMIKRIMQFDNTDSVLVKTQSSNLKAQQFYVNQGYAKIGELTPDEDRTRFKNTDGTTKYSGEGSIWLEKRLK